MKINIGNYIKKMRKDLGMTLAHLSEKSNVALATLSRIETSKMTGTIESHIQIAKVFDLSLSQFYSEVERFEATQNKEKEEYRPSIFVHNKSISSTVLTNSILSKKMLPILIKLSPDGKTNKEEFKIGTEKFIYVLDGKIEVSIGKSREIVGKNSTLYFDASQPHYIRNISAKEALYLCVITPPNL